MKNKRRHTTRAIRKAIAAVALVTGLLVAGCGRSGDAGNKEADSGRPTDTVAASADFGDLTQVCRPGNPSGSPAQGVSEKAIQVGVLSDIGFSKNPEFPDAAKVFTSWCNAAGGINGRELDAVTRDVKVNEVRQRVTDACHDDFALVGGGAGYDGLGTKDRLSCLLPDFPGQTTQTENQGSDLQVSVQNVAAGYWPKEGLYNWLIKEAYPASGNAVGIILGDTVPTKTMRDKTVETLRAVGASAPVYVDLFPAAGVSNWVPYAQAIKSKGVKGLIYMGDFRQLAKLEQELTNINYKLDWIDTNVNAYGSEFLDLAGNQALTAQNNLADLSGIHPPEADGGNAATQRVVELFKKYAPGAPVTIGAVKGFSAWLLFAKSASACGDNLTRRCVYEQAKQETAWTGGGLQAPRDFSKPDSPATCFNVVHATPDGWKNVDVKANQDGFRCGAATYKLTGSYGKPVTLADVGKSLNDLK